VNRLDDLVRDRRREVEQRLPYARSGARIGSPSSAGTVVDRGNRKDAAQVELLRDLVDRRQRLQQRLDGRACRRAHSEGAHAAARAGRVLERVGKARRRRRFGRPAPRCSSCGAVRLRDHLVDGEPKAPLACPPAPPGSARAAILSSEKEARRLSTTPRGAVSVCTSPSISTLRQRAAVWVELMPPA
jgi:hypothetical protein